MNAGAVFARGQSRLHSPLLCKSVTKSRHLTMYSGEDILGDGVPAAKTFGSNFLFIGVSRGGGVTSLNCAVNAEICLRNSACFARSASWACATLV